MKWRRRMLRMAKHFVFLVRWLYRIAAMQLKAALQFFTPAVVLANEHVESYDYIIVGGGTTGLVLANRLSEDSSTTVAVIEAGDSVLHNPNVTQIANFFASLGTEIDWQYASQPQQYTNGRKLVYDSGKALGGTSTINGATYVRAQKAQIDAWETLGNEGWNWDTLFPYYVKSENFDPPTAELRAEGANYDPAVHGYNGHVGVGWSNYTMGSNAHEILNQTWEALGLPYNPDQSSGELHGFSLFPSTIDAVKEIRADAARSYYYAITGRENLKVFTNTLAEKIVWRDEGASTVLACADGVQVRPIGGGESRMFKAEKQVILSAGSLKSPVILENSGVGNPAILAKHGIDVKVDLPTVGENLQDQPNVRLTVNATTEWNGYPPFVAYLTASDLFGSNTSSIAAYVYSQIPTYANAIVKRSNNAYTPSVVEKQLHIQADLIFQQHTPCLESIVFPTSVTIFSVFWGLLPFSRGSVHLSSTNASADPLINPNFFMFEWDAILQTAGAKMIRSLFHTTPLDHYTSDDTAPTVKEVGNDAGVGEWLNWFKDNCKPLV
jgi:choline dehydrogenase-like flavoprotein